MKITNVHLRRIIKEEITQLLNESIENDIREYIDKVYENILDYEELNQRKPNRIKHVPEAINFIRDLLGGDILAMMSNDFEPKHLNVAGRWDTLISGHQSDNGASKMPGYKKFMDIKNGYEPQTPSQTEQYRDMWMRNVVHAPYTNYRSWEDLPRDIYENPGMQ